MSRWARLGSVALVALAAAPAHGQQPAPLPTGSASSSGPAGAGDPLPPGRRYAGQTLVADLSSSGLMLAGLGTGKHAVGYAGAGLFLVGSPLVHLSHGNTKSAAWSIGLRALMPWLYWAVAQRPRGDEPGGGRAQLAGAFAIPYFLAVTVIDASVLAREAPPPDVAVSPWVRYGEGGVTLGATGRW